MNLEQLKKIFPHATAETWHQHQNPDGTVGGWVENTASVASSCFVSGNARVYGNAQVYDNARVYGNAWVFDNAYVYDNAQVYGNAQVYDNARVYGNAWVFDNAYVYDNAQVSDNAHVYDNAQVYDNARVSGDAWVYGDAGVSGDAWVAHQSDIQWITSIGSESGTLTLIRYNQHVTRGCFCGTLDDFKAAVAKKQEGDPNRAEYEALFPYLDFWFSQPLRGNYSKPKDEAEG